MTRCYRPVLALLLVLTLASCDFVGDVFEAGFWIGVILVVLVIALVVWGIFQLFD